MEQESSNLDEVLGILFPFPLGQVSSSYNKPFCFFFLRKRSEHENNKTKIEGSPGQREENEKKTVGDIPKKKTEQR